MERAVAGSPVTGPTLTFEDGLGERRYTVGAGNKPLEVLRLSTDLSAVSSFEFALRERAVRLANFRHHWYGHVRAVELDKLTSALVVVSDYVPGVRLSTLLAAAEKRSVPLDVDAARCLIRQLVSAVAAWQETVTDVCHGAIGPERIVVTPKGRLVIVEYVLGAALEQLRYSRTQYWRQLRVALPEAVGPVTFDSRVDVTQIGAVALALILGRRLGSDEYPEQVEEVIGGAALRLAAGGLDPMSVDLREWLLRTLQLDAHRSFVTANDARADLELALGSEDLASELRALRGFLARCAVRDPADGSPITFRDASTVDPPSRSRQFLGADIAFSQQEAAPLERAASSRDVTGLDAALDADLGPRLEALKSFLARYPQRGSIDRLAETPRVTMPDDAATVTPPALPPPRVQPAPDSRLDTVRVESFAPSPARGESASAMFNPEQPYQAPGYAKLLQSQAQEPKRAARFRLRRWGIAAGLALIVTIAGLAFPRLRSLPSAPVETSGTLTVGTNPTGISIFIDGTPRGITPLNVELAPGDHLVELVTESERRRIPVSITAGGQVSQFLELPRVSAEFGELAVRTDTARVSVIVDGRPVGRSPLTVPDLTPGPHTVVLQHESGSVTERVLIESGRTTSLVVSMANPPTANAAGWVSISAPADVQVYENQRLLGTNRMDRIMLPVGRHELEFVNDSLDYRVLHSVQVAAGQVSQIRLEWPQGSLALNAIPWAEVWVDGRLIGETPIGNVSVPIGSHEVMFRHPELGERRVSVVVTVGKLTKVGIDLEKK